MFFDSSGEPSRVFQSLFQQEIVRRGILSRAGMMISAAHSESDIDRTLIVISEALEVVSLAIKNNTVLEQLDGKVIQPVIRKV